MKLPENWEETSDQIPFQRLAQYCRLTTVWLNDYILFFQYLVIYNDENLPNCIKTVKVRSMLCPTVKAIAEIKLSWGGFDVHSRTRINFVENRNRPFNQFRRQLKDQKTLEKLNKIVCRLASNKQCDQIGLILQLWPILKVFGIF